jgi:two-component system, chemotaxis family, protein-glutamate methylesterase/glutaminase
MKGLMSVRRSTEKSDEPRTAHVGYEIVVMGCSWGGLAAVREIIGALPADFGMATAIIQHRHRDSDTLLARVVQRYTPLPVCEIEDKQPMEAGRIFLAPANYHMLIERGFFSLSIDAPVRYSRPSIDVALMSAADAYAHRVVGVMLTGANADGADGLRRVADAGGLPVVQDPASAEVGVMPAAALDAVPTARVFPLDKIGPFLTSLPTAQASPARS